MSLTVPKSVINNGIQGNAFKQANSTTIPFLVFELDLSAFLPVGVIRIFDGFQVDQLSYLVVMSFVFLGAVIINSQFKKSINTQKAGERMRRLRYELRPHPAPRRPTSARSQAELATMIRTVEPLRLIGDARSRCSWRPGADGHIFIMMQNWLPASRRTLARRWHHPAAAQAGAGAGPAPARPSSPAIAETADGVTIHPWRGQL
jgi:putative ABC transport system ATP-binding protein